jgi:uncharacterized protein YkwD
MSLAAARKPGRVVARTVLFGASALFAAGLLTWTPTAVTGWNQGAAEGTLWQLMNGARVNNGMAPLQQHGTLVGLARWRSQDMLNRDYFSHTIPGCGCAVYAYYDQNGLNYVWGGENIGWNSGLADGDSPVAVHNSFMASTAGHRENVLNPAWSHAGVGGAAADNQQFQGYVQNTRMYTELFMQAAGAAPAPAPAPARPAPAAPAPASRTAPAPAAPVAPAAPAEPTPFEVAVAAPVRPASTSVDGSAERVLPARSFASFVVAIAHARAAEMIASAPAPQSDRGIEVTAPETQDTGFFGDVLGTLFGFISG